MLGGCSLLREVLVDAGLPVGSCRAHVRLSLGAGLADSLEALGTVRQQRVVQELWIVRIIVEQTFFSGNKPFSRGTSLSPPPTPGQDGMSRNIALPFLDVFEGSGRPNSIQNQSLKMINLFYTSC